MQHVPQLDYNTKLYRIQQPFHVVRYLLQPQLSPGIALYCMSTQFTLHAIASVSPRKCDMGDFRDVIVNYNTIEQGENRKYIIFISIKILLARR